MSLINNMLRDLEKRESNGREMLYIPASSSSLKKNIFNNKNIFLLCILALTLALTIIALLVLHKRSSLQIAQMLPVINTTKTVPVIRAEDAQWLKSAGITGITMQVKENVTELTFLLDHPALYRLISNNFSNQISLILDTSHLESELPSISNMDTSIQNIATQAAGKDTRFDITLFPGASVKYVNLNNDSKHPELVIAIQSGAMDRKILPGDRGNKMVKTTAMRTLMLDQYHSALNAAENGRLPAAIQQLSSLLEAAPDYKDARMSLAALLLDQNNNVKAQRVIDQGLNLNPEYIPFIELKARILTAEGKTAQALAVLQTASPPLSENPEYHAFIAALYERNNNDLLAVKLYKELVSLNPQNGNWWFGLAVSLEKLGKTSAAIDAYSQALAEGRLTPEANTYLQTHLQALQKGTHETI